jgi:hypothetical protein
MKFLLWYSIIAVSLSFISNMGMALVVAFSWECFLTALLQVPILIFLYRLELGLIRNNQ